MTQASESGTRFRTVSGIVLLDKPEGLSSNAALQRVKRAFGAAKAGHAGTLDPLATGMLPILLGEATKIAGHLLHKDKAYRVVCRFGETTTTYDSEGDITLKRPVPALDPVLLAPYLGEFIGRIRQRAPIYSAIKQAGRPLYQRARRGEDVIAPVRDVEIMRIDIEDITGNDVTLHVECGTGTYIRSLAHDLGERIGCGAHVIALRRLWVEPFRDVAMHALEAIQDGRGGVLAPLAALAGWPRLELDAAEVLAVSQGKVLLRESIAAGQFAGVDTSGRLVALLENNGDGRIRCVRLLHPDV